MIQIRIRQLDRLRPDSSSSSSSSDEDDDEGYDDSSAAESSTEDVPGKPNPNWPPPRSTFAFINWSLEIEMCLNRISVIRKIQMKYEFSRSFSISHWPFLWLRWFHLIKHLILSYKVHVVNFYYCSKKRCHSLFCWHLVHTRTTAKKKERCGKFCWENLGYSWFHFERRHCQPLQKSSLEISKPGISVWSSR